VDVDGNRLDGRYLTSNGTILDKFTIIKQSVTSVEHTTDLISEFKVFPNPFGNEINVSFRLEEHSKVAIDVLSIDGKIVHSITPENFEKGLHTATIDFGKTHLSRGTYIVRINSNGAYGFRKVTKTD
jgi:hypothetical protein